MTAVRFFIGSLVIFPLAIYQYRLLKKKINLKDIVKIGFPGFLNVCISMMSLHLAVYFGKASLSAILISVNPIFAALFGKIILKEPLTKWKILGIILGIFGISFIIGGETSILEGSRNALLGFVFGMVASVSFGLYTVISKRYVKQYGNFVFNSISFLIGSICLTIISFILGAEMDFELNTGNILVLLYMGIFVSGLAYFFFFEGLRRMPVVNGSMMFFLKPVIATILAVIFLNEVINLFQIIGVLIVLIGINIERVILLLSHRKEKTASEVI